MRWDPRQVWPTRLTVYRCLLVRWDPRFDLRDWQCVCLFVNYKLYNIYWSVLIKFYFTVYFLSHKRSGKTLPAICYLRLQTWSTAIWVNDMYNSTTISRVVIGFACTLVFVLHWFVIRKMIWIDLDVKTRISKIKLLKIGRNTGNLGLTVLNWLIKLKGNIFKTLTSNLSMITKHFGKLWNPSSRINATRTKERLF